MGRGGLKGWVRGGGGAGGQRGCTAAQRFNYVVRGVQGLANSKQHVTFIGVYGCCMLNRPAEASGGWGGGLGGAGGSNYAGKMGAMQDREGAAS